MCFREMVHPLNIRFSLNKSKLNHLRHDDRTTAGIEATELL